MQFLQDGHFGATLSGQLVPQHAVGSRRRLFDADRVRGGADQVESDVEWLARDRVDDLGVVHGRGDNHVRGYAPERAQHSELQLGVALAFADTVATGGNGNRAEDEQVDLRQIV